MVIVVFLLVFVVGSFEEVVVDGVRVAEDFLLEVVCSLQIVETGLDVLDIADTEVLWLRKRKEAVLQLD